MKLLTILIPTKDRPTALAATLTSLLFQTYNKFDIVVSDQGEKTTISKIPTFQTLQRLFLEKKNSVSFIKHLPIKGMAEQRQFLLENSHTTYSLFLDDDLILYSFVIKNLLDTIRKEGCGFVGQSVIGLSYLQDFRPHEQKIEFWKSKVKPEKIDLFDKNWFRYILHNAANLYHLQKLMGISPKNIKKYKVAWIGGCVMYNTQKLKDTGGFNFWKDLPKKHTGEDVLAQLNVMEKYGGCGIIPSGVFHQELSTTIPDRKINAPEYLA